MNSDILAFPELVDFMGLISRSLDEKIDGYHQPSPILEEDPRLIAFIGYAEDEDVDAMITLTPPTIKDGKMHCTLTAHFVFTPDIPDMAKPYIDDVDADDKGHKRGWTTMPYKGDYTWQDGYVTTMSHELPEGDYRMSDALSDMLPMIVKNILYVRSERAVQRNAKLIRERIADIVEQVKRLPVDQRLQL